MKLFSLIAGLLLASLMQAQVGFNVFAGPQLTTASYNVQGKKQSTSHKFGFHAGAGLKVPFEFRIYFVPAIYYSMKGYKVEYNRYAYPPDITAIDNNTTFHTVETAFLLQYDLTDKPSHPFIRIGPTLDFQIYGTESFTTPTEEIERNIPFGYNKYGHYSANMLFQVGYEMKNGLIINGTYSHGLANLNNADQGPRIRHRVYGISIGKFFGKTAPAL
jgi:hypothetical protein